MAFFVDMRKLLALSFLLVSCASTPPATQCNSGAPLLNASLWVQSAAEYKASAAQTYNTATRMLDAALANGPGRAAVIFDIDETVLDNSEFESRMIRQGIAYDGKQWTTWVSESRAIGVPGAAEFAKYAMSRGVTPFYITNRLTEEEPGTRRNLEALGFPLTTEDNVLTRNERPEWKAGDKTARREYVASRYRVVMLVGDDLNDFVNAYEANAEQREAIVRNNASKWGTEWLIVPNPMYGSWERTITGGGPECPALKKKMDALR